MQYLTLLYLSKKGELPSLEAQNPSHFAAFKTMINRFFTLSGGASYHHPDIFSPQTLMAQYGAAAIAGSPLNLPAESVLYAQIMQNYGNSTAIPMAGFVDRALSTDIKPLIIRPLYSVEQSRFLQNYYGLKFLHEFDLLDNFYLDVGGSRYLEAEGAVKPYLKAGGYFASTTNLKYMSHLQNTFFALGGQKILIDFDTGQTFATYYTQGQIQSILDFVQQYVLETGTLWYAIADSPSISPIEATYYCFSILKVLSSTISIEPKIVAYIQAKLNSGETLSIRDLGILSALAAELGLYFPYTPSKHSHSQTETVINSQISKNMLNASFSLSLAALSKSSSLVAFVQYQPLEIAGNEYTMKLAAGNWINMQTLSEIRFAGFDLTQDSNGIAQIDYMCPFDPENPSTFSPLIEFRQGGIKYESRMTIVVSYSYQLHHYIALTETKCTIQITIQAHPVIYQCVIPPSIYLYYEDVLMHTAEPSQITYISIPDGLNISCFIPKSVFQKSPALTEYTVYCNFTHDFMNSLQIPLDLDGSPIIDDNEPVINDTNDPSQNSTTPKSDFFSDIVGKSIFIIMSSGLSGGIVVFAVRKKKNITNEAESTK